jgi:hypothetical protein
LHNDAIKLSLIPTLLLSEDRAAATERVIGERGWPGLSVEAVWAMPAVVVGDVSQIAAPRALRLLLVRLL